MHDDVDTPWADRVADRLGHFAPEILSAAILGVIVIGLYPPSGPLAITVPVALVVMVLGSWLLMRRHDRRLCEQCVASMPLNPAQRAEGYKRRFWVAHAGGQPRFLIPYLILLIGSNFVTGPIGRTGWALMQLTMVYLIMSHTTHRRLQPWCPWCRNDGGGADEDVRPDPLPEDHRQLI